MRRLEGLVVLAIVWLALALVVVVPAAAGALDSGAGVAARERDVPPPLRGIRIDDRAGSPLPLDLTLTDQDGVERKLGDLFDGTAPVVLVLGYYRCPMLCAVVFERLDGALAATPRALGRDFRAAAVSIDPSETAADARARRDELHPDGAPPDAAVPGAWTFFVAGESASRRLAEALGFRYRYDEASGQYAHAAGAFVLTPDGRVSRTLYGLDFAPGTLDAALDEAAAGRSASALDAVLVQCFRFMPALRRHAGAIRAFLRAGAAVILVGLATVVVVAVRRRRPRPLEGSP